ncbi:carboxymuconolactone decarboxylase family protein [Candidatus Mycobacterium wuenschmannii]|uniref:Carboxymuconolactone decarboxylase family protein n=1 Tax=Candidatus Mycobacterium wuenschmannii TaxID=3027808 RepID=A0ABY8W2U5_9MYCO|nr:carboxymuconolactone decarboxylase family protein [Candidatus Mycobacterium wuenschmannii]WIM89324.1 carboxymuconolactone decarboxylase family protein [Candidatus Mycobacterium wuenschmannii]
MVHDDLTRLVALSPGDGRVTALVRQVCGRTLGLPALPSEADPADDRVVAEFAEQFSVDVSAVGGGQRSKLWKALGDSTFSVVVQMYIADFVPRVRAGLEALGVGGEYLGWVAGPVAWDDATDPSDIVFNTFLPTVARLRALDALTAEVVRLRGATQHNCRLCKSLRETTALDVGGTETLYEDIERFEESTQLTDRHKAALRYADALIWSPASIAGDVAAGVRAHFSDAEAVELTLDVMRNASNKIAVALGGDAPRVEHGTEQYLLDADGQTVYS